MPQSTSEEQAGRRESSLLGSQHVDHLPELVHSPVQVDPPARDLDVGLVDEPPVPGGVPTRPGSVNEQRGEPLHPAVHGHVIDLDAAFGEVFFDVAVGQSVAQIPPQP
jgi:hypothetical protein